MKKGRAKPYDALIHCVGKVRRNSRMPHILAISPGTDRVGAWPWCSHVDVSLWKGRHPRSVLSGVTVWSSSCSFLLWQHNLLGKMHPAQLPLPQHLALWSQAEQFPASSSSWPLDPFQKQLFHLGSVDASGSVMCWGCWWLSVLCSWDCREINAVLQLGTNYLGGENHRMCGNFWAYKWDICPFSLTALRVLKGAKGAQMKSIFLQ